VAYSVDDIASCVAWVTSSGRTSDDSSEDFDSTTCSTNGTVGEECDEIKDALPLKIGLDLGGGTLLVNSKVQVYVQSIMSAGDFYLLPYSDANSVIGTNEIGPNTASAGAWMEFTLTQNFVDDLAAPDGDGFVFVRWASDGTAKLKHGEVEADLLIDLDTLTGVSLRLRTTW